jgi:hypothetical protein
VVTAGLGSTALRPLAPSDFRRGVREGTRLVTPNSCRWCGWESVASNLLIAGHSPDGMVSLARTVPVERAVVSCNGVGMPGEPLPARQGITFRCGDSDPESLRWAFDAECASKRRMLWRGQEPRPGAIQR